jgi:hypothetical protein
VSPLGVSHTGTPAAANGFDEKPITPGAIVWQTTCETENDILKDMFTTQVGNASFDATQTTRGRARAVKITQTGSALGSIRQLPFTSNVWVGRFWIFLNSITPAATQTLFAHALSHPAQAPTLRLATNSTYQIGFAAGTFRTGTTALLNTWQAIDYRIDLSGSAWTIDWQIDGAAQTQATGTGQDNAPAWMVNFKTTNQGANTISIWFQDFQLSTDPGAYPLPDIPLANQLVSPPAATATASAPTPGLDAGFTPAAATASASALVPVPALNLPVPAATAAASAPVPTIQISVATPVASASASALIPALQLGLSPPAASASASALVPGVALVINPPAATASASAPVPIVASGQTVLPPAATATASAPTPAIQVQLAPPAATSAASSLVPVLQLRLSPAAATGAAAAFLPTLQLRLSPGAASASASSLIPVISASGVVSIITVSVNGYVRTGDTGPTVSGDSGRAPAGDAGTVKAGLSGQVRI